MCFFDRTKIIPLNANAWEQRSLNDIVDYRTSTLSISDASSDGKYDLYDANGVVGKTDKNIQATPYITIIKDGSGVGRVRLLPKDSSFIGTLGTMVSKDSNLLFDYAYLTQKDFRKHITGANIPHVYFSEYGMDDVIVPSIAEQAKIGNLFSSLDSLITLHQRE